MIPLNFQNKLARYVIIVPNLEMTYLRLKTGSSLLQVTQLKRVRYRIKFQIYQYGLTVWAHSLVPHD